MWWKTFLKWLKTMLEEDSGKLSIKRVMVLILSFLTIGVVCYTLTHASIIMMGYLTGYLELVLPFKAVLLGLTYIPSFTGKTRDQ